MDGAARGRGRGRARRSHDARAAGQHGAAPPNKCGRARYLFSPNPRPGATRARTAAVVVLLLAETIAPPRARDRDPRRNWPRMRCFAVGKAIGAALRGAARGRGRGRVRRSHAFCSGTGPCVEDSVGAAPVPSSRAAGRKARSAVVVAYGRRRDLAKIAKLKRLQKHDEFLLCRRLKHPVQTHGGPSLPAALKPRR
jgi:hypothetical protein